MTGNNRTGKGKSEGNVSDQSLQEQIEELKELVRKKDEELARFHDVRYSEKYKSRLFSYFFGREENKRWTLGLYNAVNHILWKAFHKKCYAKLSVMRSQLQKSRKIRKSGAFYFT